MTSWCGQHPAKRLSVDLDQVDVTAAGFWWCLKCRRITELLDSDNGLGGKRCAHCRSSRVEWKEGTASSSVVREPQALPQWAEDPPEPRRAQKMHRLSAEKRDLRVLAVTGYHFCYGCREITEPLEDGSCGLCKSGKVEWNDPVFTEEKR